MNEDRSAVGTLTFLVLMVNIAIFIVMVLLFNSIKKTNETLENISKNSLTSSTSKTQGKSSMDSIIQDNKKDSDSDPQEGDNEEEEQEEDENQQDQNSQDEENSQDSSTKDEETSQLEEEADLTAEELVEAFKEDEEAADQKYKSNNYLIFGEVAEISETDSDKVNILLDAGGDGKSVACLSPITQSNTQESVEEKIKTSDKIVVEGRVDGIYENEVELENCSLKQY
ncbi:MAG: hypothetical protein GF335_03010 [Candidatus Moranbacteria bacterium]|nr:hypothetical protein [Candidatus Moranbacteria bacterium]